MVFSDGSRHRPVVRSICRGPDGRGLCQVAKVTKISESISVSDELIDEYIACAEEAASVNYADKKSVRQFNALSDRMRAIATELVTLGQDALVRFASVLNIEPAAGWAAHHLVEMADVDSQTLVKCFQRFRQAKLQAEAKGDLANAMGEEMWLKEWMERKA